MIEIANVAVLGELLDRELAVSDWLDVTQARIDRFAEATDDRQWIHVDGTYDTVHLFDLQVLLAPGFR